MRVMHLPFCFYPDAVGGTEIYVASLADELKKMGCEPLIAAPSASQANYEYRGIRIFRYALSKKLNDLSELYDDGNVQAALSFGQILDNTKPHVVHFHAFTRGVSLRMIRESKKRNIPTIFTYHTPTVSCQRGTLMRWGTKPCDGEMKVSVCSGCTLHGLGMNRLTARMAGRIPSSVGRRVEKWGLQGDAWTVLRMTQLVKLRHETVRDLMEAADRVVAVSQWVKDLLLRNGVPEEKIVLSRQGLCQDLSLSTELSRPKSIDLPLKIAFMGRMDKTKGVDVLIKAIKSSADLKVHLTIFGVVQGESSKDYVLYLRKLAMNDPRFMFHDAIPQDQVVDTLKQFHVLAVPSPWMETGPLVVQEAFAAGIPVIGARLGGIQELVKHDVNGWLVDPPISIESWNQMLWRLVRDKDVSKPFVKPEFSVRSMKTVAEEMQVLYRQLIKS